MKRSLAPKLAPRRVNHASDQGLQDLNFKVSPSFHREFKTTAVVLGLSMKDLLEATFRLWKEQHGQHKG